MKKINCVEKLEKIICKNPLWFTCKDELYRNKHRDIWSLVFLNTTALGTEKSKLAVFSK